MHHIIIFFIAIIVYSVPIDEFAPLDYSALPAHKIYGYIDTDGSPFGLVKITGSAWVINDPSNNRYARWYTITLPTTPPTVIDEYSWVFDNTTYTKGSFYHTGCLENVGWNWTNFVSESKNAYAQPDSNYPGWSTYFGLTRHFTTCNRAAAQLITLKNNEIVQESGAVNILIPSPPICYNSKNIYEYDRQTIEYGPFDDDFVLPSDCYPVNNPPSFCDYVIAC